MRDLIMKVTFFRSQSDLRRWFEKNHSAGRELLVGYYKKASGKPSITWPESVDQALCFGWIDGIRRSLDEISYTIRFTPRKPTSTWSAVNIKRVQVLTEQGLMLPAGLKAFAARRENKSGIYSYEQRPVQFVEPYESILGQNKAALAFFLSQPPSYRKTACWWVLSAKTEATRLRRLEKLIEESKQGRRLDDRYRR
jgi:uncharacterized protein YdeI (YjbR/CyaY-like superfamily)